MVLEGHPQTKVGIGIPSNDSCAPAAAAIKSSKRSRLNKTPQRGLGVAQLERLRCLEEQHKNAGDASSSLDPSQPFGLSPPPRPVTDAAPMNEQQRPHQQQPPGFSPTLWDAVDLNDDPSAKKIETPFFSSNARSANLVYMKRQQRPPTELVNSSSTFLLSPGVNQPMEPPSNQNTSNNYDLLSCWRDQGKNLVEIVGNKLSHPSHLDNPTAYYPQNPLLSRDDYWPPIPYTCRKRSDRCSSTNDSNLGKHEFQAIRGTTSTSFMDMRSSDSYSEKRNKEGCRGNDGVCFSLGSVSTSSSRSIGNPVYRQYDCPNFGLQHNQKSLDNVSSSNGVLFYNFLPPGPTRNEKRPSEMREPLAGGIDLDLKL
ncbi:uncharacterized protein LOC122009554 isoform X1 [Zingiber officinale]|uniref:uncharacterized protein LOC122009554 isoform X1 n=1 Tax=Zingiber officinale TaxID=94328 RepID=UPI001C4AD80E|nr:uncharacterized protein LOC122009554 isoform X1 [Zingiber officinale]